MTNTTNLPEDTGMVKVRGEAEWLVLECELFSGKVLSVWSAGHTKDAACDVCDDLNDTLDDELFYRPTSRECFEEHYAHRLRAHAKGGES